MSAATPTNPAVALLLRLASSATASGWESAATLAHGLPWAPEVLHEHLADLVAQGRAMHNARTQEYRLVGEAMARKALARLLRGTRQLEVVGQPMPGRPGLYRIGMARRLADGTAVMAEIELPAPTEAAAVQALAHGVHGMVAAAHQAGAQASAQASAPAGA